MGLTPEWERWLIVETWQANGKSASYTARKLNKPLKVVNQWVRRYESTGTVKAAPKPGRRRLLSKGGDRQAHALLLQQEQNGAHGVALELSSMGITSTICSKQTIIRAANRAAKEEGIPIHPDRRHPRKALTDNNKQSRIAFSQANLSRCWDNVMVTDRKRFLFVYPGAKVHRVQWVRAGEHREAKKVNHADSVNVYGGITVWGVTKLHEVAGTSKKISKYKTKKGQASTNITQQEYSDVLMSTLLPEGERIFHSHGTSSWMLQQDNDKAHAKAGACIAKFNRQAGSSIGLIRGWPPNSPDLSPIENLWGQVQANMEARGCKNFKDFCHAVHEEWAKITPGMARRYVRSVHNRLSSCLELHGNKTKY